MNIGTWNGRYDNSMNYISGTGSGSHSCAIRSSLSPGDAPGRAHQNRIHWSPVQDRIRVYHVYHQEDRPHRGRYLKKGMGLWSEVRYYRAR